MTIAVIGLGSNILPEKNVGEAVRRIGEAHRILAKSRILRTEPIGFSEQPDFLNGVILVETEMTREELKTWLRGVEDRLGRVRTTNKYGPRTIDLDILVWEGEVVDEDVLERDFLRKLIPEVLPELRLGQGPGTRQSQ